MQGRYDEIYPIAEEALAYLRQSKGAAIGHFADFYLLQMVSCIYTDNTKEGLVAYKKGKGSFQSGNANWYTFLEYSFMFMMHHRHYQTAAVLYEEAIKHTGFITLNEVQKQRWHILNLYLLFYQGQLKQTLRRRTKSAGELRSLLDRVMLLKQDKEGYGFDVRLLLILHDAEEGNYHLLTESIESFQKYCIRHFKREYYPKTRAFLKLLLLLDRYSFNAIVLEKRMQRLLNSLKETTVGFHEVDENIQVLPYEEVFLKLMERFRKDAVKIKRMIKNKEIVSRHRKK